MKNVALTLLFYVALGALTWLGFDQGVAGAANVVMFIVWGALLPVALLCVIALLDPGFAVKAAAKPGLPRWALFVARCVRWYCLAVLVWQGAWFTGIALTLFMISNAMAHKAVSEARQKVTAEALAEAAAQGA